MRSAMTFGALSFRGLAVAIAGLTSTTGFAAADTGTVVNTDSCEKTWTFKEVRTGMTVDEVKATHPNLKHRTMDPKGWYTFPIDRMQGVWGAVFTGPAGTIVGFRVGVDDTQTTSAAMITSLTERLGAPTEDRRLRANPLSYSLVTSNIATTYTTTWHDPVCDRMAMFVEDTRVFRGYGSVGSRSEEDWYVLVLSGESVRELTEQAKEGARKALE